MSSAPLVSIVIPVWNEEKYINDCLESIKNQSFKNFECILTNDGSSDDSASIIKKFCEQDTRFILINTEHKGIIHAINFGLKRSKGMLIARMDADDLMPVKRLELQVAECVKRGDHSFITGKIELFSQLPISAGFLDYQNWLNSLNEPIDFINNQFMECVVAAPSWMMHRQDVFELGLFRENVHPEDFDFTLRALAHGIKIFSIPETVLFWREYPERSSRVLDCYKHKHFWGLRAQHFEPFLKQNKVKHWSRLALWGGGKSGKACLKALEQVNMCPTALIDIHPERLKSSDSKYPVYHYKEKKCYDNDYHVIAVGQSKAKREIEAWLQHKGLKPVIDYMFFC
jgi:glycosyltransferase involved in cell wall biosynthesis